MNAKDAIEPFLHSLRLETGQNLSLDDREQCTVATDDGVECVITAPSNSELMYFQSPLLPLIVSEDHSILFAQLLKWNMHGEGTRGCTLAVDQHATAVVICFQESVKSLDEHRFLGMLDGFLHTASELIAKIAEFQKEQRDEFAFEQHCELTSQFTNRVYRV